MKSLRDDALEALKRRTARLVRLLELEAPDLILVNEAQLIAIAARLLSPEAWIQNETQRWLTLNKPRMGYCAEDGCEEPLAPPDDEKDRHRCAKHQDDDNEDDEDDGSVS